MILMDSDILIWILRNNIDYKNKFVSVVGKSNGQIFITPIQYLEIIAGIKEREIINTEIFLDSLGIINIDKTIGKLAGEFIRIYNKSHNVQNADAIMAAVAKIYRLTIWTNNKKHFPMLASEDFLEFPLSNDRP